MIANSVKKNDDNITYDNWIQNKFKNLYPDLNPNTIDEELLNDIIANMINDDISNNLNIQNQTCENINKINSDKKFNSDLKLAPILTQPPYSSSNLNKQIEQNLLMAYEIIPEMLFPTNLIYLNGKINGINTNVMVDSGATCCFTYKSVIKKCGLEYLIDTNCTKMIMGAHGIKPSFGTIWFVEIEIELEKNHWVSIPISVDIIDDTNIINTDDTVKNNEKKLELILGMTFLKSYRANIDFSLMTITLNKNIKIKFK